MISNNTEEVPVQSQEPLKFFVQLRGYGVVDGNNKTIMGIEQSSKRIIAPENAPLALVVTILQVWEAAWKYSDVEAAKADLKRLKDYVDGIEIG